MEEAIDRFSTEIQSADFALFYFSGHGVQVSHENFLLPVDFAAQSGADVKYRAYSASRVRDKMEESGARVRLLILDACRDNPFHTSKGLAGGLVPMTSDVAGTLIAFATADGQTAEDNPAESNGLYTKFLLKELQQPGLDVRSVFRKAGDEVYSASNHKQRPYIYDGLTGESYLREGSATATNAAAPSAPVDVEREAYQAAKSANTRSAFEAFLKEFPSGQFSKIARVELAGLSAAKTEAPPSPLPVSSAVAGGDLDRQGTSLHAAGRYQEELSLYRRAAESGNPRGWADMGYMYAHGTGVVRDETEAARLYRKGVDAGDPRAQALLGVYYSEGRGGVPKDYSEALRLCRQSADAGNGTGMNALGLLYSNGWGVNKDPNEAVKWFRKAADAGSMIAQVNLARCYANGNGVAKDTGEALRLAKAAAAAGEISAFLFLGNAYSLGQIVPKDQAEGFSWMKKAADAGEPSAMFSVGLMYGNAQGVPENQTEAVRWYRKAAEAGSLVAMNNLGVCYFKGTGVQQDQAEAARWYRKAAEGGYALSARNLAGLYANGTGVVKDQQESMAWLRKAADLGDEQAKQQLAQASNAAPTPTTTIAPAGDTTPTPTPAPATWRLALDNSRYRIEARGNELAIISLATGTNATNASLVISETNGRRQATGIWQSGNGKQGYVEIALGDNNRLPAFVIIPTGFGNPSSCRSKVTAALAATSAAMKRMQAPCQTYNTFWIRE
jgi:TPR repeat protein